MGPLEVAVVGAPVNALTILLIVLTPITAPAGGYVLYRSNEPQPPGGGSARQMGTVLLLIATVSLIAGVITAVLPAVMAEIQ